MAYASMTSSELRASTTMRVARQEVRGGTLPQGAVGWEMGMGKGECPRSDFTLPVVEPSMTSDIPETSLGQSGQGPKNRPLPMAVARVVMLKVILVMALSMPSLHLHACQAVT